MSVVVMYFHFLFMVIFPSLTGALFCHESLVLGGTYSFQINISSPKSLCYNLNSSVESEALRIFAGSDEALTQHPVLITVRQLKGVTSWSIPFVESGLAYNSVHHTLCPLLNTDNDPRAASILVDLSSSSWDPVNITLRMSIVKPYRLKLNTPEVIVAAPSSPSFLVFKYPSNATKFRVKFTSTEDTKDICAIASVQSVYCPVVELLDNPDDRGRYQTMRSIASINIGEHDHESRFGFFYTVLSVFPNNGRDENCDYTETGFKQTLSLDDCINNYNPLPYDGDPRVKRVFVTVEPALPDFGYRAAMFMTSTLLLIFYIVACSWITVFDYWRYDTHPMYRALKRQTSILIEDIFTPMDDYDADHMSQENPPDSFPCPAKPAVPVSSDDDTRQQTKMTPSVRPSFLSVLAGVHWKNVAKRASSIPYSPVRDRKKRLSSSQLPSSHSDPSLPQSVKHPQKLFIKQQSYPSTGIRQRGVTGPSFNLSTVHDSESVVSHGPPAPLHSPVSANGHGAEGGVGSEREHAGVGDSTSESEDNFVTNGGVERLTNGSVEGEGVMNGSVEGVTNGSVEGVTNGSVEGVTNGNVEGVIGGEEISSSNDEVDYKYDTSTFPVNILLSELGKFDECQSAFDYYPIYLLVIGTFYAIPAFQLVITYRWLTATGNEDICYHNSLCSHPWSTYSGITLSAFNNLFSNIGFFSLGLLLILITYRRRQLYRVYVQMNLKRPRVERMGVPQQFGIYYALGMAMMAQGIMSVAYHMCPTRDNFRFDSTFMYVQTGVGIHKLLQNRCPDKNANLHEIMLLLAALVISVVVGMINSTSPTFWWIFFISYILITLLFSIEVYYRWQVLPNSESIRKLIRMYRRDGVYPPRHMPKFVLAVVSFLINSGLAVVGVILRPSKFGSFVLYILLINFMIYLVYYIVAKMIYKELDYRTPPKAVLFAALSFCCWAAGVYFFFNYDTTDWNVSPALSRDMNEDCWILGFYDSHDLWHFLSGFAVFFSALLLMTLDDRQEVCTRDKLMTF